MSQAVIKLISSNDDRHLPSHPASSSDTAAEWQRRLAYAYTDLQGRLDELVAMAEITADVVDKLFKARQEGSGPFDYFIPDRERDHALFCVFHLAAMIQARKNDFDKTLDAG